MNEHDLEARLQAKYRQRSAVDAPPTLARRVLAIPATSPRRRGWLPRPIQGGRLTVFQATKIAAAVTVLAVSGSLFLGYQAGDRAAVAPPGADIDMDLLPGYVDGTVTLIEEGEFEPTAIGQGYFVWSSPPSSLLWYSEDPRLSGTATATEHGYQHFDTYNGVRTVEWVIENDDGSWSGTGSSFSREDGGEGFVVLTGHGGYDGLSAYVAFGQEPSDSFVTEVRNIRGVIFPAGPPTAADLE